MKTILCVAVILSTAPAFAQQAVGAADALNAKCEAARQEKLDPIRRAKIAQCERSAQRPTAGCEAFYSTYGDNSNHRNGSAVQGRFYDLPECVQAKKQGDGLLQKQDF